MSGTLAAHHGGEAHRAQCSTWNKKLPLPLRGGFGFPKRILLPERMKGRCLPFAGLVTGRARCSPKTEAFLPPYPSDRAFPCAPAGNVMTFADAPRRVCANMSDGALLYPTVPSPQLPSQCRLHSRAAFRAGSA